MGVHCCSSGSVFKKIGELDAKNAEPFIGVVYGRPRVTNMTLNQEQKALISFVLGAYPSLGEHIPPKFQDIFENTTYSPTRLPRMLRPTRYSSQSSINRPSIDAIVENYFRTGCEGGFNTAIENLFYLASLKFGTERWLWYQYEVAVLHGALMIAIRYKILAQVKRIAYYAEQRAIDLLDIPDKVRLGTQDTNSTTPELVKEALNTADFAIAQTVIGYRDEKEKEYLTRSLQSRMQAQEEVSSISSEDLLAITEAVETVICFWKRPSVQQRYSNHDYTGESSVDLFHAEHNFGPSVGDVSGMNAGFFGANMNAEIYDYVTASKVMFEAEMKAENKM